MQWATEVPADWQLSGKCAAYMFGCSEHGELADGGKDLFLQHEFDLRGDLGPLRPVYTYLQQVFALRRGQFLQHVFDLRGEVGPMRPVNTTIIRP
jgi:hypothetical protein